jgi:hypothetical protein
MKLIFTINGVPAGNVRNSPPGANDVHLQWAGGVGGWIEIVIITVNGKPVKAVLPPPGANDIGFSWASGGSSQEMFSGAFWTRDGEPIRPIPLPPGANDAHFMFRPLPGGQSPVITKAWWTKRGKLMKQISVPKGANDFHLG